MKLTKITKRKPTLLLGAAMLLGVATADAALLGAASANPATADATLLGPASVNPTPADAAQLGPASANPASAGAALLGPASANPASAAPLQGPSNAAELAAFTDQFFQRQEVKDLLVPGAAIVVVKDGKVILQKGYGYADVTAKIPVDPAKTVFRLGSISKAVTATAVMQLVEQQRIDLNRNIEDYLDGLHVPSRFQKSVTMEHLLTHTTGFDFTEPRPDDISTELDKVTPLKTYIAENMPTVVRPPGESYNYDNFASMLQGYIVQNVSGQPFHRYMQDHIFSPLGMNSSGFLLTDDLRARLAEGYMEGGQPYPLYTTSPTELPQGGMFSTAEDMAKFMMAHLDNGAYGSSRILQASTAADMRKVHLALNPKTPVMAYGFDMSGRDHFNGRTVIGKGGNIPGYSAKLWLLPEQNLGLFIATNSITKVRDLWFQAFMDHYYPAPPVKDTYLNTSQSELARFEGAYGDLRTKARLIQVKATAAGTLLVMDAASGKHELRQIDELLFKDKEGNTLAFQENQDGTIGYLQYLYDLSTARKLTVPPRFTDVPDNSVYAADIAYLQLLEVLPASQAGSSLGAAEPLSRGEFAELIANTLFMPRSKQPVVFADAKDHPAGPAIQTLYELGLVKGRATGSFLPGKPIARQEAAVILARTLAMQGAKPMEAKIAGPVDAWALDSVKLIAALGLYGPEVQALPDGSLDYKAAQPMLRQEAAAMIAKALRL